MTTTGGTWQKTIDGAPLWVPAGATRCESCGGEGALYGIALGDIAEIGSECPDCHGAGYLAAPAVVKVRRVRRKPSEGTTELVPALRGSLTLARGGVGRFSRAAR